MRIVCILITHLRAKAELRRRERLRGKPLAVIDRAANAIRPPVIDNSPEASGVTAGMTLSQALSVHNNLIVLDSDAAYYRAVFDGRHTSAAKRIRSNPARRAGNSPRPHRRNNRSIQRRDAGRASASRRPARLARAPRTRREWQVPRLRRHARRRRDYRSKQPTCAPLPAQREPATDIR